jgi:DNA invertase Pin-like site-specific DNA recombinase
MILSWFCQIQIDALEDFGVDELFREKKSGKSIANKIQLKELLDKLECGDGVAVYKLDRLDRSISDVWKTYESFQVQGIDLISISEGIDTRKNNDLMTKALITMLGLFF